jgi:type II secretory pathway component PulM
MSNDVLFGEGQPATTEQAQPVVSAPVISVPSEVAELVGADKKYKSVEDALKSLPHAQAHIAKLEQEAKELREQAAQARSIEDLYNRLGSNTNSETPQAIPAVVDEGTLGRVFEQKLAEREALQLRKQRLDEVREALTGKFGEKAPEVFQAKAKELGVSDAFLTDIIAASPKAGLELFKLAQRETQVTSSVPAGGLNTLAVGSNKPEPTNRGKVAGSSTKSLVEAWRSASPLNNQ